MSPCTLKAQLFFVAVFMGLAVTISAHADALSDVKLRSGNACGLSGSIQMIAVNTNTAQRVFATITVDSNVKTYKYLNNQGAELDFNYPYQREAELLPGGQVIVGCTKVPVSYQTATQSFTLAGAFYPDPGAVFPNPPDNPDDFVGWIYKNVPQGSSCEDGSSGGPLVFLQNRHPFRSIVVDAYDSLYQVSANVVINPQYGTSSFGCKNYKGVFRQWKINNARFGSPAMISLDQIP